MPATKPDTLLLYVRARCTLCDEMIADLGPCAQRFEFAVETIDIDRDPELVERYGDKVPVLVRPDADGDYEICHYFLDEEAVAKACGGDGGQGLRSAGVYTRIYALVRQIPRGRVATYGQIAALEGKATARQVGYALAALPDGLEVPWQRVVNAAGKVSERTGGGDSGQRRLLTEEGVVFRAGGRLSFEHCGWEGPDYDWLVVNGFEPARAPHDR